MILNVIQLIVSILLVAIVLIQSQGSGLGGVFGGDGAIFRTKRGAEKKIHLATVILAVLFFAISLINVLI